MFSSDIEHLESQLGEMTLPPIETLVILLSCQKTVDRQEACRETWLAHGVPEGMKVIFLVGRPGQPSTLSGDILYLDCPDSYLALPQKTYTGIREALLRWDFNWIFKADDDTFINLMRLKEYPRSRDYMGKRVAANGNFDREWHLGKCKYEDKENRLNYGVVNHPVNLTGWAHGGVGYFLSRRAARLVGREPLDHVNRDVYEDRFVGHVMASYGIFLHGPHYTLRALHQNKPGKSELGNNIYGTTTLHQLLPEQMREVYWRLLRAGELGT